MDGVFAWFAVAFVGVVLLVFMMLRRIILLERKLEALEQDCRMARYPLS